MRTPSMPRTCLKRPISLGGAHGLGPPSKQASSRGLAPFLVLVACAVSLNAASSADDVPSVDHVLTVADLPRIEKHMIASRMAFRSGHVVVRVRTESIGRTKGSAVGVWRKMPEWKWSIWFDGDKWRSDLSWKHPTRGDVLERVVETNDVRINAPKEPEHVVVVQSWKGPPPGSAHYVPDPRLLGLICWAFETNHGGLVAFENAFLRADRENLRVERGTENGEPVWKVKCEVHWPGKGVTTCMEYRVSPGMGWMPVYMDAYSQGKNSGRQTLTARLARQAQTGIWFPTETDYRHFYLEKLNSHQAVTVDEAEFGIAVPPETFTLAGLGLQEGRRVLDDDHVSKIWKEGRLVRMPGRAPPAELQQRRPGRYWLLAVNAVLFAAAAAWLLWRHWRRLANERRL